MSKKIKDEVLNHWIASADDFTLSPGDFYEAAEKEIAALKIPGLETSREEYAEGGVLSDKRVYLRFIRERLAFDVCAAQFGTRYIFSCRTIYSPAVVKLWHIIILLVLVVVIHYELTQWLGVNLGSVALLALILSGCMMLRGVVTSGLNDIDAMLLKTPVIGPIYDKFFRKETYHRQDTRLMYLDTVPNVIQKLAEDITATKGVKLVRQYQVAPILGELYKPLPPRSIEPQK